MFSSFVNLIAGVDSFRRIANLEINTALQAGFTLDNRQTYIFCYARINSRFKDYNRTFGQISANSLACTNNRRKVGSMVLIDRCRHGNDVEFCFLQICFIRSEHHARLLDSLITDFICRVFTVLVKFNLCFVEIKAYNLYAFICKSDSNRHTDITETYKRNRFSPDLILLNKVVIVKLLLAMFS